MLPEGEPQMDADRRKLVRFAHGRNVEISDRIPLCTNIPIFHHSIIPEVKEKTYRTNVLFTICSGIS
jgi:hypothetical protein